MAAQGGRRIALTTRSFGRKCCGWCGRSTAERWASASGPRGRRNGTAFSGWRANGRAARIGWCATTIDFSNCNRKAVTTRQRRAKCWCAKGGTARWPSSTADARCAGKRSRRLPGPVLSMRSRSALRFRWPNGSGYPQSVIRGARPLAGRCKSERRRRSPRDHRWPCPPLRPKRSALRAPQGCAPGKANNQLIPKNQKLMRNQKGDTSNELRMGTFLKSFDKSECAPVVAT